MKIGKLNYSFKICLGREEQGENGGNPTPPPETERIVVEKMALFPKPSFVVRFSIIKIKNQFFYRMFIKSLQTFTTICVFRPNTRKAHAEFVKLFQKSAKIMHFKQFSNENNWKFSITCVFRPNAQKFKHALLHFLTNMRKMHFRNF